MSDDRKKPTVPAVVEEAYYNPQPGQAAAAVASLLLYNNGDLDVFAFSGTRVRLKLTADEQEKLRQWPEGTIRVLCHLLALAKAGDA